jgi:hypothetical protein
MGGIASNRAACPTLSSAPDAEVKHGVKPLKK